MRIEASDRYYDWKSWRCPHLDLYSIENDGIVEIHVYQNFSSDFYDSIIIDPSKYAQYVMTLTDMGSERMSISLHQYYHCDRRKIVKLMHKEISDLVNSTGTNAIKILSDAGLEQNYLGDVIDTISKIIRYEVKAIVMQKYIRGWLSRRKHNLKRMRLVNEIKLLPPLLNYFPGGEYYHESMIDFFLHFDVSSFKKCKTRKKQIENILVFMDRIIDYEEDKTKRLLLEEIQEKVKELEV